MGRCESDDESSLELTNEDLQAALETFRKGSALETFRREACVKALSGRARSGEIARN